MLNFGFTDLKYYVCPVHPIRERRRVYTYVSKSKQIKTCRVIFSILPNLTKKCGHLYELQPKYYSYLIHIQTCCELELLPLQLQTALQTAITKCKKSAYKIILVGDLGWSTLTLLYWNLIYFIFINPYCF